MLIELAFKKNNFSKNNAFKETRDFFYMQYLYNEKYSEVYKTLTMLSFIRNGSGSNKFLQMYQKYQLPWTEDEEHIVSKMSDEYKKMFGE